MQYLIMRALEFHFLSCASVFAEKSDNKGYRIILQRSENTKSKDLPASTKFAIYLGTQSDRFGWCKNPSKVMMIHPKSLKNTL